jgi:hypothetical protein
MATQTDGFFKGLKPSGGEQHVGVAEQVSGTDSKGTPRDVFYSLEITWRILGNAGPATKTLR